MHIQVCDISLYLCTFRQAWFRVCLRSGMQGSVPCSGKYKGSQMGLRMKRNVKRNTDYGLPACSSTSNQYPAQIYMADILGWYSSKIQKMSLGLPFLTFWVCPSPTLLFKDFFFPSVCFPLLCCHRNKPGRQEVPASCPCKGEHLFG